MRSGVDVIVAKERHIRPWGPVKIVPHLVWSMRSVHRARSARPRSSRYPIVLAVRIALALITQ
jgi:hypothetical protein